LAEIIGNGIWDGIGIGIWDWNGNSAQKVFKKIPENFWKNLKIPEIYFFYRIM
jgi:hypothetical protein